MKILPILIKNSLCHVIKDKKSHLSGFPVPVHITCHKGFVLMQIKSKTLRQVLVKQQSHKADPNFET